MSSLKVVCKHCQNVNTLLLKESYKKALCGSCKHSLLETKPYELDEKNFDYTIVNTSIPVVVDFWAPWCGPCKMFAPTFEQTARNYPLKAFFAKVNTEKEQILASKYNIRSIPTLVIFKDGKEVHRASGALDQERLNYLINSFI